MPPLSPLDTNTLPSIPFCIPHRVRSQSTAQRRAISKAWSHRYFESNRLCAVTGMIMAAKQAEAKADIDAASAVAAAEALVETGGVKVEDEDGAAERGERGAGGDASSSGDGEGR